MTETRTTVNRLKIGYRQSWTGSKDQISEQFLEADIIRSGTSVSAWRHKIATMQDASSGYQVKGRELDAPYGAITSTFKHKINGNTYTAKIYGNWLTTPGTVDYPGHDGGAVSSGTAKYYSKVAGALAPFKGFVFIGELKDSLATVGKCAMLVLSAYRATLRTLKLIVRKYKRRAKRRREPIDVRALLQELADLWLLWAFGISPLLADIESAADLFFKAYVEVRSCKCRSGSGIVKVSDATSSSTLMNTYDTYKVRSWTTRETTCRFKGAVSAVILARDNPLSGSAAKYGLTFREFVPSLWELTPWSFLVDYFVNVQDVLNSVAYHTADHIYSVKMVKTTIEWNVCAEAVAPGTPPMSMVRLSGPSGGHIGKQTAFQFDRSRIAITDVGFVVRYPPLGSQWANMLALAVSKLSRQPNFSNL